MKKILFVFVLTLSMITAVSAQKDETIFGCRGVRLTGVWGGYNHVFSTFGESFDVTKSGYFTFEISKNVLLGWERLSGTYANTDYGKMDLVSNGFTFGYSPLAHKSIHPVFGLYMGRGALESHENKEIATKLGIAQPSVELEMNIFRWFKLGVNAGYRFALNSNLGALNDEELSGPYAGLKLKFGWSWGR